MKILEGNRVIRLVAVVSLVALLGSACGGRPDVYAEGARQSRGAGAGFDELTLPETIPAVPAFVVTARDSISNGDLDSLSKMKDAAIVVPASVRSLKVKSKKSARPLKVASLPAMDFRNVAPNSTRTADFVWFALVAGDVVMTQDAADKLKLDSDTEVSIAELGKTHIGALADNATPNFADVMVSSEEYQTFGAPNIAVVGAKSGVSLDGLEKSIKKIVPNAKVTWLLPRSETVATQQAGTTGAISVPSVAGMHPTLAASVSALISASNGKIWIVSGYRTTAHQYELWQQALQKYGSAEAADNWVAPPGSSFHERGLAVDLGGDLNLAVQLIQQMQLPLYRPMSWEAWHFELSGSRG